MTVEPLGVTVAGAMKIVPFRKTKLHEMIADGTLDSVKVGHRRIIKMESLRRLVEAA